MQRPLVATRDEPSALPNPPSKMDGLALLLVSFSVWVVLLFWMAASKMLPPTKSWLVEWMREDEYYCFLVPLTIVPVSLLANYLRWFASSLFQTNEW